MEGFPSFPFGTQHSHTALQIDGHAQEKELAERGDGGATMKAKKTTAATMSPLSESLWRMSSSSSAPGDVSAWLSWKDLRVEVLNHKGEPQVVLDGLTGYAEPGHFMAIMGPSGSGKSTLLDTLAG